MKREKKIDKRIKTHPLLLPSLLSSLSTTQQVTRLKAARERRSESIAKKRAVRAASLASKEAEEKK